MPSLLRPMLPSVGVFAISSDGYFPLSLGDVSVWPVKSYETWQKANHPYKTNLCSGISKNGQFSTTASSL